MPAGREHAVSVSLTAQEHRVLREIAALRRISTSELIREALHLATLQEALEKPVPRASVPPISIVKNRQNTH
jgi:hypothetical protein